MAVRADLRGRTLDFNLRLPGEFNIRNALTALAMVDAIGGDLERAAVGLGQADVSGRMQRVELGPGAPLVYVDFAHTPQAIAAALEAVGAPPHRGRWLRWRSRSAKREPMGESAARHADVVIATDDNPRSEDPAAIRAQLITGARAAVRQGGLATEVIDGGDRRSAINLALRLAAQVTWSRSSAKATRSVRRSLGRSCRSAILWWRPRNGPCCIRIWSGRPVRGIRCRDCSDGRRDRHGAGAQLSGPGDTTAVVTALTADSRAVSAWRTVRGLTRRACRWP